MTESSSAFLSRRGVLLSTIRIGVAAVIGQKSGHGQEARRTPAADLPRTGGISYSSSAENHLAFPRIMITQAGVTLDNIDCSGCYVSVHASNVTLRGCRFTVTEGVSVAVDCYDGASGILVETCHFDGLKKDLPAEPMLRVRDGTLVVRDCLFENLPSDGIAMVGGLIEHCRFRGSGYLTGAHADAIWIPRTIAPVIIRDNDIDFRRPPDAKVTPNTAIQVVPEFGDINDVLVENNRCLGGSYTIQVSGHPLVGEKHHIGRVIVRNNLIDDWAYGPLYPQLKPTGLLFENNHRLSTNALLTGAPLPRQ